MSAIAGTRASELSEYQGQLEQILGQFEALTAGLDDAAMGWRPGPNRWSIAHALDHLNATARVYLPALHAAVGKGREHGSTGDQERRLGWFVRWLVSFMEPPPRMKVKAPKPFRPGENPDSQAVRLDYARLRAELAACMEDARGLDLGQVRMPNPVFPIMRLKLGDNFAMLLAHERRHLWQADRVKRSADFPG